MVDEIVVTGSKLAPSKKAGFGALLLTMAAGATALYQGFEGNKLIAYKDIVGVWTICSGDTRNVQPGLHLTQAQCDERTAAILKEFGTDVADMSPGIEKSQKEWQGHTIFAANVGIGAYGKSSVRRLYNAGDYRGACRAMRLYDKAGGRVIQGLKNRREGTANMVGEYELCIAGALNRG